MTLIPDLVSANEHRRDECYFLGPLICKYNIPTSSGAEILPCVFR